ncbi:hypothetical protein LZ31DRAFT_135611 [Colletotrichum somersetense]|nr:hypothetical protein LZ31DRAFT_135611 [Colletotrichum somersetense]
MERMPMASCTKDNISFVPGAHTGKEWRSPNLEEKEHGSIGIGEAKIRGPTMIAQFWTRKDNDTRFFSLDSLRAGHVRRLGKSHVVADGCPNGIVCHIWTVERHEWYTRGQPLSKLLGDAESRVCVFTSARELSFIIWFMDVVWDKSKYSGRVGGTRRNCT